MAIKIIPGRIAIVLLFLAGGVSLFGRSIPSSQSRVPAKIEISGPSQVAEESTAYYTCKAYYDDGRSEDVTSSASWSEDCWSASLSSGGKLTTSVVTRDETCRISASCEGMSDSLLITIKNVSRTVTRLEVEGPNEVNENESAYFKCWAYYDDGDWENVTDSADWTADSWQAGFEYRGRLVARSVTANTWIRCLARFREHYKYFDVRILNNIRIVTRLEIRGPREIRENGSAYYTCWVFFDDGGTEDVTGAASWSEDSWYADVSGGGHVSTKDVDEDQWFKLSARFQGREDSVQIKIVNGVIPPPPSRSR